MFNHHLNSIIMKPFQDSKSVAWKLLCKQKLQSGYLKLLNAAEADQSVIVMEGRR